MYVHSLCACSSIPSAASDSPKPHLNLAQEEALEVLKSAQAAIEQAWACKDARALGRMRRLAEAETALYEKAAAPSREPSPADNNPTGRRRRRAAPTNLAELDPSPRPLQKRKGASMVTASDIAIMHSCGSSVTDGGLVLQSVTTLTISFGLS